MVHRFFSIGDAKYNNYMTYFELFKGEEPRVPTDLVPIARDPGGNLICISIGKDDLGAIYFWDHEMETEGDARNYYENVFLIASSFSEFLKGLK